MKAVKKLIPVLLVLAVYLIPQNAAAHAFPDHSAPKVGATVSDPPGMVKIWFDSDLEPAFSTLMVHNANDQMVDKKDSRVDAQDPTLLEVSVPKLPPGKYKVIWDVVARDGHRTNGDYTFTVK